jgi:pyridoxamine 5'-phosphate oxidase
MRKKQDRQDRLDKILDDVWTMLARGVSRFSDPFHWPVLGTGTANGCSLRTVILRQVLLPQRLLVCHTDARAAKAQEIVNCDRISWLFYHPRKKIQLRVTGPASLHSDDDFADRQWAATRVVSRLNYCALQPPGTVIAKPSSGLPDFLHTKVPRLLESQPGRRNFMVIASRIDSIDWLVLRALGPLRARFEWNANRLQAKWLIP